MIQETDLTEFNSNKATLERLDRWLRYAAEAHLEDNASAYFKHLRNVRHEVMVKAVNNKHQDTYDKLKKMWNEIKENWKAARQYPEMREDFMEDLDEFEHELRIFANEKGMLLRDNYEDAGL